VGSEPDPELGIKPVAEAEIKNELEINTGFGAEA
jgi:hypothetical protein